MLCPGHKALWVDCIYSVLDHYFMFVRLVKKKNDHVSIRIVESLKKDGKVRQKTVCCVGHFHKENLEAIETSKRIGEELIVKIKNEIRPTLPGFEAAVHAPKKKNGADHEESKGHNYSYKNLTEEARIRMGIDDVFCREYKQLGLLNTIDSGYKKEESNDLLKDIVMARIDKPSSKRRSMVNIKRDKNEDLNLDSIYSMMDKLHEREEWVKDAVARKTLSLFKEKINVAFFDVTTLYFESFIPDELRVSGYSKDNKVKETQVVFTLMTTIDGLPLGYDLFPGNTYEGGTLINAVDALCKRYDVVDTSIVADRGMFTKGNLKALDDRGINFIVSAKLKNMKKDFVEIILTDVENVLSDNKREITSWLGEYEYQGRRLVVGYSKKRASKDKADRERLVSRVKKKLKDGEVRVSDLVKNTGTKKYLKFNSKNKEIAVLDEDKIKQAERWDGIYGIVSSHDKMKVSGEDIFDRYRGLWQIEDAFRINKHDLRMRPIFHWSPKRVKSHILICYMAYALVAIVRHKLKQSKLSFSIERIKEELGYIQASVVRDKRSGKRFLLPSKPSDAQRVIYKALGLDLQEKVQYLN